MATQHNSLLDPVPLAARSEIHERLEDILRSVPFRTSRQCQDLFRYVVQHSLNGSDDSLRERVIGIEVFGRAPNYDTAEDPVVRVRAADVRKRLAQYYQAQTSEPGSWKIEIPTGSYKAQFHFSPMSPQIVAAPAVATPRSDAVLSSANASNLAPRVSAGKRARAWAFALVSACLAIAFVGAWLMHTSYAATTPFELFWEPVLKNPRPVLLFTGSNPVYMLSMPALSRYKAAHPQELQEVTPNLEILVPAERLKEFTAQDFIPVKDTYLTIGDAWAVARVSSLLSSRHHAFDVRFADDLTFSDLREGPAITVGAFSNSWTLRMMENLRFVFDEGDTPQMHVQDKFDRSRSWWPKISHGRFTEDYAIVSRILDSKTGEVLLTIAGLDHTGSRAAGDFVTNPQLVADLVSHAPKDWSRKNLQVVLHTNIVNGIPDSPTVVAAYYW